MTVKYRVAPGHLLRHHDYSVRAYAGDVIADSDSALMVQPDIDHCVVEIDSSIAVTPRPLGDDPSSDYLVQTSPFGFTSGIQWSDLVPSVDTRFVYVSSSTGNDANSGLDEAHPKATIAAGKALLRDHYPDWLLLKRGDTFFEALGTSWRLSGRSIYEPMVVGSYGTGARPKLHTGTSGCLGVNPADFPTTYGFLAFVDMEFFAHTYTGGAELPTGIGWLGSTHDVLFEGLYVHGYATNINFQGYPEPAARHTNIRLRRSGVKGAYNTLSSNSQGLFVGCVDGLLIEGNIFHHNGWDDGVPGSEPTIFRHNVYVQNGCTGVVYRDNICGGTDGPQIRCGGLINGNIVTRCGGGITVGYGDTPEPGGVIAEVTDNIVIEGRYIDVSIPVVFGIRATNLRAGSRLSRNLICSSINLDDARCIWFQPVGGFNCAFGTEVTANICHSAGLIHMDGSDALYSALVWEGNVFQSETNGSNDSLFIMPDADTVTRFASSARCSYWEGTIASSAWFSVGGVSKSLAQFQALVGDTTSVAGPVTYPHPERTVGKYYLSLGVADDHDAFMDAAVANTDRNAYKDILGVAALRSYLFAGFGR